MTDPRKTVRIPSSLNSQIADHVQWLMENDPAGNWTEAGFLRWCFYLGCQATKAGRFWGRPPAGGPDLSRMLEEAWDRMAKVLGWMPAVEELDEPDSDGREVRRG